MLYGIPQRRFSRPVIEIVRVLAFSQGMFGERLPPLPVSVMFLLTNLILLVEDVELCLVLLLGDLMFHILLDLSVISALE